jgi:hypothetical protein
MYGGWWGNQSSPATRPQLGVEVEHVDGVDVHDHLGRPAAWGGDVADLGHVGVSCGQV